MSRVELVNKKAGLNYEVVETLEAGMVLTGQEVKSLRLGRGSIGEAFVKVSEGEAWLVNANVPGYSFADTSEYEPTRRRKLLLSRKQIETLRVRVNSTKLVLVPLRIYLKEGRFKVEVGIVRPRKRYQKKEVLRRRDLDREAERELKARGR